ncbi:MAG: hypothetical protein ACKOA8_00270 [Deltaproteobacteria bacterium]
MKRNHAFWLLLLSTLIENSGSANSKNPKECETLFKKLNWVRARYVGDKEEKKSSPEPIKQNKAFRMIPEDLRESLISISDNTGQGSPSTEVQMRLEAWAYRLIEKRIDNLKKATPNFRQLDFWMYDKNGPEAGFAIRRYLKPEVGFFGVGHGKAGGDFHSLYPVIAGNHSLLQIQLSVNSIIDAYAALPGVKKSSYIFYKTCSGGLGSEDSTADAERLAKATGVPVIAPMGILSNSTKVDSSKHVIWSSGVLISKKPRIYTDKDSAYRIFTPDGKSEPITFQKMKELLFRPEAHPFIQYIQRPFNLPNLIFRFLSSLD